jgi:predicted deacylase
MMLYVVAFREQTLTYHYSGDTCGRRLVLFPSVFSQIGDKGYKITAQGGFRVAGRHIVASSLCVSPLTAPVEDSSETVAYAPWGGWIARFTYTVETKQHPTVNMAVLEKPIPASRELILPLSEPDTTFTYTLTVNNKEAPCSAKEKQIACDLPQLELTQGSAYQASLKKYFKGESVEEVARSDLETLSPISVVESSIHNDTTVYDKPTSVTLGTDKPVRQANITVWRTDGDAPQQLQVSTESKGQEIKVTFAEDLPRQATIELKATLLEATDGSTPLDEKILAFKTAGGPRVTAVNVGSSGIGSGTQIIVTFDQELSSDQDLSLLITTSGGVAYQARQSNQLIFSTNGASICGEIAITLKSDIKSPYDISGLSAWQYNGRMRCYTTSVIGYSVEGRPINAYFFGSGQSTIYTGAIHGNEVSTKYLMDRWIQELDAHPSKIPAGKRVIVVPLINPDGFARGTRVNARNVDLNRNFGVSDWKKDIEDVRGNPFPGGGGEIPMSEPETKAIAGFIAQQRPSLVISYHSTASLVIPNQIGQSGARASQYASLSGYKFSSGGSGEFGYQITGTADDYYGEQLGIASILIELGSQSYHQFEHNQSAMWAMM